MAKILDEAARARRRADGLYEAGNLTNRPELLLGDGRKKLAQLTSQEEIDQAAGLAWTYFMERNT